MCEKSIYDNNAMRLQLFMEQYATNKRHPLENLLPMEI